MRRKYLLFLGILLTVFSCDWNGPETIYIAPELKEWIVDDAAWLNFSMQGTNTRTFTFEEEYAEYSFSKNSALEGMKNKRLEYEAFQQGFRVNQVSDDYSISMKPGSMENNENIFKIELLQTEIAYNFTNDQIWQVVLYKENRLEVFTGDDLKHSSCKLMDSLRVNGVRCDSVIQFKFNDLSDLLIDESVVEMYYAKYFGLVKFVLLNGVEVERIWQ